MEETSSALLDQFSAMNTNLYSSIKTKKKRKRKRKKKPANLVENPSCKVHLNLSHTTSANKSTKSDYSYFTSWICHLSLISVILISVLVTSTLAAVKFKNEPTQSLFSTTTTTTTKTGQKRQQDERVNLVEADENGIYLVGLFDLHQSDSRAPLKCGRMELDAGESNSRRAMQNLEAFLWAIEQVNADKSLLPGVRLGSLAIDTCSSVVRSNQQLANLLHEHEYEHDHSDHIKPSQIAALIADQADWLSLEGTLEMSSAQKVTTFITQSRSSKLASFAQKYRVSLDDQHSSFSATFNSSFGGLLDEPLVEESQQPDVDLSQEALQRRSGKQQQRKELEGFLSELLGVGKMLPASSAQQLVSSENQQHDYRLYMIRMPLGNELLAESLAALLQHMNWDFVSILHEEQHQVSAQDHSRSDMHDLHEELIRQLLARQLQIALDEQIVMSADAAQNMDRLVGNIVSKSQIGARVVLCLLSTGSSRLLLESLHRVRASPSSSRELIDALNSLVWISVADREPFYARASDALGTIAISSAVPLIPEFKSHFEQLESEKRARVNRWWPEYLRAILTKESGAATTSKNLILQSECARNLQEPSKSPAREHCKSLSLSKLMQQDVASVGGKISSKFGKYSAGGWEHNGMDVINSVLAAANGLEAVRQSLCPALSAGLCPEMRRLVMSGGNDSVSLSELMYSELLHSSFQLADGRMFNLDELHSRGGAQLEGKFKLYNLRYLQANSVGFVRFGQYDQLEGIVEVNSSKANYYPTSGSLKSSVVSMSRKQMSDGQPLDSVQSTCEDERRCLMLSSLKGSSSSASDSAAASTLMISEEELAQNMNTLFKLDHPALLSDGVHANQEQQQVEDPHVYTMRSKMPISWSASAHSTSSSQPHLKFNIIILVPLHHQAPSDDHQITRGDQEEQQHFRCGQMDIERSFQQLVAIAYALGQVNGAVAALGSELDEGRLLPKIELTSTVVDYCEQAELASQKLANLLNSESEMTTSKRRQTNGQTVAVIDFEPGIGEQIEGQLAGQKLLHLSLGSAPPKRKKWINQTAARDPYHLRLAGSRSDEIRALVALISSMPNWRLVHLIYTDEQERADEFVKHANEANICVSKLIWIPPTNPDQLEAAEEQLEKTRALFARELHDFSTSTMNTFSPQPNELAEGLNSTRVLVLLASSSSLTNQLIIEAASPSMRDHYVWISSHEWFSGLYEHQQQQQLPRLFLASKPESFESPAFHAYLSSLSPAIHQPIPTRWFDEFWQQRFNCRLPMEQPNQQTTVNPSQQPQLPLCADPNFQAGPSFIEDERSHQVIESIEAIQAALLAGSSPNGTASQLSLERFARDVNHALSLARNSRTAGHPLAHLPVGFQIVHRWSHKSLTSPSKEQRRSNSRHLWPSNVDHQTESLSGQLMRVGLWRDGQLLLIKSLGGSSSNSSAAQLHHLWWLNQTSAESETLHQQAAVEGSLVELSTLHSRCSLPTTCSLCRLQLERANRVRGLKEGKITSTFQSGSASLKQPEPSASSQLATNDLSPNILNERVQRPLAESSRSGQQKLGALAQASGQLRWPMMGSVTSQRHSLALLVSAVCLVGVASALAGSSYVKFPMSDDIGNTWSARGNFNTKGKYARTRSSSATSINDYFLLTGLLMLYSINVAFLLPATGAVCWLRRIGLTTSYTLMFTAILIRAIAVWGESMSSRAQRLMQQVNLAQLRKPNYRTQAVACKRQPDPIEEGVELTFESLPNESAVGVASESQNVLGKSQQANNNQQQRDHQIKGRLDGQQDESGTPCCQQFVSTDSRSAFGISRFTEPTNLLVLALILLLTQLVFSLIWSLKQPAEPTLYFGCWLCASPIRSPLLALYEPLLSFLYPALVLLLPGWCFSLANFRLVMRKHQLQVVARAQGANLDDLTNGQLLSKLERREANSLVMSTTLLVFTWSALTLNMISLGNDQTPSFSYSINNNNNNLATNQLYANKNGSPIGASTTTLAFTGDYTGISDYPTKRAPAKLLTEYELSLVYANLISGAIVFSFLFVYRLNLIKHFLRKLKSSKTHTVTTNTNYNQSGASRRVLKFNQPTDGQSSSFAGSTSSHSSVISSVSMSDESKSREQERLKLHQFNSFTYSTYSPSSHTIQPLNVYTPQVTDNHKNNKHNKIPNKRAKPSFFRNRSTTTTTDQYEQQNISGIDGKSNRKGRQQESLNSCEYKLQRRQSANSVASSTAKLVISDQECDTISLGATSVASSSTSQVYGNELYPLDYSIQFDGPSASNQPLAVDGNQLLSRSLSRRSLHRASMSKLDAVYEEQMGTTTVAASTKDNVEDS